jgi:hypothetical protein
LLTLRTPLTSLAAPVSKFLSCMTISDRWANPTVNAACSVSSGVAVW